MNPIGSTTFTSDYSAGNLTGGLPNGVFLEVPAAWSVGATSDPIVAAWPAQGSASPSLPYGTPDGVISATGALKATNIASGTSWLGTLNNLVCPANADGNDGDSEYRLQFCIADNGHLASNFDPLITLDDGYVGAGNGGTGLIHGIGFQIQNVVAQGCQLSNQGQNNPVYVIVNGIGNYFLPRVFLPNASNYFPVSGLWTNRVYEFVVRKWRNCIRIGIYDVALGLYLAPRSNTAGTTASWTWPLGAPTGSGYTYPYTGMTTYSHGYYTAFHSLCEFQCHSLMAPMRLGMMANTTPTGANSPNVYIGKQSWKPYAEAWWPKNLSMLDPANLPGGANGTNGYAGPLGPVSLLTAVTNTAIGITARAPINCTAPSYQWQKCATPGGTFVNIVGATALVLSDTGLAANTLYYYQLVATVTDLSGISRVITYPQAAFRTLGTARTVPQSFYIDSAAGTNGTGTIGSPFNSLANFYSASVALIPGDSVILVSGSGHAVYSGTLTIQNATGLPTAPIVVTSSNTAFPATIQNFGSQYASGDCVQLIDTSWVTASYFNLVGPGILQLGVAGNVERDGTTIVGAGATATRTCTAGHGVLIAGTQPCWCPDATTLPIAQTYAYPTSMRDCVTSGSSIAPWHDLDQDNNVTAGFHGEDAMWHYSQGNVVSNMFIQGMYKGIVAFAPGTHDNIGTPTLGGGGTNQPVTYYPINYRQGQEYLTIQNNVLKDIVDTGVSTGAEYWHRDPAQNGLPKAINPLNDPYVWDPTLLGTDPYALALYGAAGTILQADVLNAGSATTWTGTTQDVNFALTDLAVAFHHRNVILLNNSVTNVPGDNFYANNIASGYIYNMGNGYGVTKHLGMPGGWSGNGLNLECLDGVLYVGGDHSYTGRNNRGGTGSVGMVLSDVQYGWIEQCFVHNSSTGSGDGGAIDIDNWTRQCWMHRCIVFNSAESGEFTSYTNQPYNVGADHCTFINFDAGITIAFGGIGGHRLQVINCTIYTQNPVLYYSNPGQAVVANSVIIGNAGSAIGSTFTPSTLTPPLHQMVGSYLYNYNAAGVMPSSGSLGYTGVTTADPGLPNRDAALGYPLLVINGAGANGTNAPSTAGYGFAWAVALPNAVPTALIPGGLDPRPFGFTRLARAQKDITGALIAPSAFPVGSVGVGTPVTLLSVPGVSVVEVMGSVLAIGPPPVLSFSPPVLTQGFRIGANVAIGPPPIASVNVGSVPVGIVLGNNALVTVAVTTVTALGVVVLSRIGANVAVGPASSSAHRPYRLLSLSPLSGGPL